MNIKEAKKEISQAIKAYFTKNEYGEYVISIEKQRPVFLMGPPGIGKTAIMEQVAQELGVALVSYSMAHHTRQSALGLPFIVKKQYGDREYDVSEYTMSEIIASVYEKIEETGIKEGILFLDEINCVSETLAPAMLQFLQYKTFGRHSVPEGWIVVTAGNPPEFNNSVREFDIVTWDRLKRIDVDADYDVWKEYAYRAGVHPAIISYLDIKKSNFYKIESTVDGKTFVTARGWCDLSEMMYLYEKHGFTINEDLIIQYLQNSRIAKDFAIYYDLYNKYKSDYQVNRILEGKDDEVIRQRARDAQFDERLTLLSLLIDAATEDLKKTADYEEESRLFMNSLKNIKAGVNSKDIIFLLDEEYDRVERSLKEGKKSNTMSRDLQHLHMRLEDILTEEKSFLINNPVNSAGEGFDVLKGRYSKRTAELKKMVKDSKKILSNVFNFVEEVFEEGQEILILVTELTINYYSVQFISRYGCDEYFKHNKELLFYERQKEIISDLGQLDGWESVMN